MKENGFLSIKLLFWLCLVVLFTVQLSVATAEQAPEIEWQKCLGGSSSDYGTSIEQTSDGGYIVAGGSYSNDGNVTGNHGSQDSWVVKLDKSGDIMWQKCLGGSSSDYGGSIEQTSDGGYIIGGFSISNDGNVTGNHGSQDAWVVKLDKSGDVVWQKCLGGSFSDYIHNIGQTSDGGYIVVGHSFSNDGNVTGNHGDKDSWVVKLDESGNVAWQKCLGGSSSDFGSSIEETSDGGYIVAGGSSSVDGNVTGNHGSQDAWVVKLDESGDVVWQKCLGGSFSESGSSIEQTSDGGYIVAGYSSSNDGNVTGNHGSQDAWVLKLDESGDVVWQKCLGGSSIDYGSSIEQTPEGGYIVAGYSGSNDGNVTGNHGSRDSWVVKLDENGDVVWQKCLGGSSIDYGRSIERTSEGDYIVAGYSGSNDGNVTGNHGKDDYWIVKLAFQIPVADFSAIPMSGSAPLNVSFTDNSKDNPAFWLWDFGDGANSVEQNPVHIYSTAGNYTVNLTVSNENGTDSKFATITVSEKYVPVIPVANFSSNVTEGYAPLSVQFNDTSENATSVNWDFNNDGISDSLELNPVHEYADPENYTVNLTVSNENGTDSKLATITVSEKYLPVIPVANFSSNVTSGYAPLSVQFTDLSKNATEWNWDFGDNTPISIEQSPEHIFNAVGTYTVTLVATNGDGSSDEISMDITVNRVPTPPVADFTASTTKGTSPLAVKFTDASANNPTRWEWNFGDNTPISIEQSPEHTYATTGTFTANLIASNADGIDATSKTITVTATTGFPKARFKAVPFFGRAPLTVKFTDKSVNATGKIWNFGDGTISTAANPIHTYKTGGFYTAKLTATNGDKSSTASKVIYVAGRQYQPRSPPRIPDTGTSESENPKCL